MRIKRLFIRFVNFILKLKCSTFSTLRIFHTPHFPHSSFSTLLIFHTLRIFHTPHFSHPSFSTLRIFHTPYSTLRVFHRTLSTQSQPRSQGLSLNEVDSVFDTTTLPTQPHSFLGNQPLIQFSHGFSHVPWVGLQTHVRHNHHFPSQCRQKLPRWHSIKQTSTTSKIGCVQWMSSLLRSVNQEGP